MARRWTVSEYSDIIKGISGSAFMEGLSSLVEDPAISLDSKILQRVLGVSSTQVRGLLKGFRSLKNDGHIHSVAKLILDNKLENQALQAAAGCKGKWINAPTLLESIQLHRAGKKVSQESHLKLVQDKHIIATVLQKCITEEKKEISPPTKIFTAADISFSNLEEELRILRNIRNWSYSIEARRQLSLGRTIDDAYAVTLKENLQFHRTHYRRAINYTRPNPERTNIIIEAAVKNGFNPQKSHQYAREYGEYIIAKKLKSEDTKTAFISAAALRLWLCPNNSTDHTRTKMLFHAGVGSECFWRRLARGETKTLMPKTLNKLQKFMRDNPIEGAEIEHLMSDLAYALKTGEEISAETGDFYQKALKGFSLWFKAIPLTPTLGDKRIALPPAHLYTR